MKDAFRIQHSRRFWTIAISASVVSTVGVLPFVDTTPWIICIPILFGGVAVTVAEFSAPKGAVRGVENRTREAARVDVGQIAV